MTFQNLQLRNFRNFTELDIQLHPHFNFIFGKNAQGKTNLIEALFYLSGLKSFRATNKEELIQNGKGFSKIETCLQQEDLTWNISITLTPQNKQILVNGKRPQKYRDYFELIPAILFEPRHIYLFRDTPSERRIDLDRSLSLTDATYLDLLQDYKQVISHKNKILKEGVGYNLIEEIWNEKLIDLGSQIIFKRLQWFDEIKTFLTDEYRALSGTKENFSLAYHSKIFSGLEYESVERNLIREKLKSVLKDYWQEEVRRRESLIGPHRDDFCGLLNERNLSRFASQGENRSAVIALKLAQLKLFEKKFEKTPIFLLDDVASELDENRVSYLFSYLRDKAAQVFLTTTENDLIHKEYQGRSYIFLIEEGTISMLD